MKSGSQHALRVAVILPAGGRGTRMGGTVPKQYLRVGGRTILGRTLSVFGNHPLVVEIVIACAPEYRRRVQRIADHASCGAKTTVVDGGTDRQSSVWNALSKLQSDADIVLVHDAVRPFVTHELVSRVIRAAARYGAAVAAIPVRETLLREGRNGMITGVIDRSTCRLAQTPQGFRRDLLERAFRSARRSGYRGTDDSSLVLQLKRPVKIVEGLDGNSKITTPHDLRVARRITR